MCISHPHIYTYTHIYIILRKYLANNMYVRCNKTVTFQPQDIKNNYKVDKTPKLVKKKRKIKFKL